MTEIIMPSGSRWRRYNGSMIIGALHPGGGKSWRRPVADYNLPLPDQPDIDDDSNHAMNQSRN